MDETLQKKKIYHRLACQYLVGNPDKPSGKEDQKKE